MLIGTYNVFGLQTYPELESACAGEVEDRVVERFAGAFAELGCDLLAIQEGHQSLALMQSLAGSLGETMLAAFPSPVNWPGYLLSRHTIIESRVWSHFSPQARSMPLSRCAGAALVDVGESQPWAVVVIHLFPRREETERRAREARLLDVRIAEMLELTPHMLVMGDFNSGVEEAIHTRLKGRGFVNAMETVGGGLEPTVKSAGPGVRSIDHIYLSAALAPRLEYARVVRNAGFHDPDPEAEAGSLHSDHMPVVASIADERRAGRDASAR